MSPAEEEIRGELEQALQMAVTHWGESVVACVRPIIDVNLARGRVRTFLDGQALRPVDYVGRVLCYYQQLNGYLDQVQVTRSPEVWTPLLARLETWAYYQLLRLHFRPGYVTQRFARDCAADAGGAILASHFPYDTEFERWAYVLVQNACRRSIGQATRPSRVPDNGLVSLDNLLNRLKDGRGARDLELSHLRHDLCAAVEQLSTENRRQVIRLRYFEGYKYPEIVAIMGKSFSAVYKVHFEAIRELRHILGPYEDRNG